MAQQQNTYLFALEANDTSFIGATPERLLLGTKEAFATACIAGTIKTGQTPEETKALGAQLLQDRKNTGEHQIVVERLAKELAKMTTSENSIQAPIILENRDVQHLYVPISGQRKPGISFLESVMQLHPTPALGGEPKELAVEWIRQYEPGSRGLYGAPIGWISGNDDSGEFAVALRSGVFAGQRSLCRLWYCCGFPSRARKRRNENKISTDVTRNWRAGLMNHQETMTDYLTAFIEGLKIAGLNKQSLVQGPVPHHWLYYFIGKPQSKLLSMSMNVPLLFLL